jgi:AcrR family transcriptional regulator
MTGEVVKGRRGYDNTRRAEQARANRARTIDAARALLLEQGYGRTTIAQVAAAAGVSPESVYKTFGGKGGLVKAVYDVTLAGDDEPVPLRERPEFAALVAERDPRRVLERYAAIGRTLWERIGPLLGVLLGGAQAGDPDLVAFEATIRRESFAGASGVVGLLDGLGALRAGLPVERARDELWLLIQPESYRLLVGERGWTLDQVEDWLARSATAALLGPPAEQPRSGGG